MLFSRDDVASFINQNFEPVWESVRPVPIVTINFGNGTVVTRTLHGNIATYVCTSEGQVIDILPGIYEPASRYTASWHLAHWFGQRNCSSGCTKTYSSQTWTIHIWA